MPPRLRRKRWQIKTIPILQTQAKQIAPSPRTALKNVEELDHLRLRIQQLENELLESSPTKSTLPPMRRTMMARNQSNYELTVERNPEACRVHEEIIRWPATLLRRQSAPGSLLVHPIDIASTSESITESDAAIPVKELASVQPPPNPRPQPQLQPPPNPQPQLQNQTKLYIDTNGEMKSAISQRAPMYDILRQLNVKAFINEDEVELLKKMIDAEIPDVCQALNEIGPRLEDAAAREDIQHIVSDLFQSGSPSKIKTALETKSLTSTLPSPVRYKYPLQKIAKSLQELGDQPFGTEVTVLVSSGAYNPVHLMHIRAFYLARRHAEANTSLPVVGGIISPSHDTFVRTKTRRTPCQMIPSVHRLTLLEAATASSSWVEVDKWEITRRRVLDYLSTLTHVRESCEETFPNFKFKVMYVCGVNTVVKLNQKALREEGFACIVVCRPNQTDMLKKHLGTKWTNVAHIVEDCGVISCALEATTSMRVRNIMIQPPPHVQVKAMVGTQVFEHMQLYQMGDKLSGQLTWTKEDRAWRTQDKEYVEYQDQNNNRSKDSSS